MPKDDLIGPVGRTPGEGPSDLGQTIRQDDSALTESLDLSLPKDVEQHATAPRIPGYVLTAPIGRGAYAQVWKAWQIRTGRMVAVKVFQQSGGANWVFLQREVERMVKLDKHPNVVSLLDADLAGAIPYYIMELMESGSLERYVDPRKPVVSVRAVGWMEEIASALAYVHSKGVIHCDLKPANVLEDEGGHARVVDFGQARGMTDSSGALGTLFYMAPEQAQVSKEGEMLQPDVRWDVYALGATIYALLTGKAPHGETLQAKLEASPGLEERLKLYRELARKEAAPSLVHEAKGQVDEDLAAVVGKCLEAAPERRYESVSAVLEDLKARRAKRPVSPLAHRRGYRLKRYVRRNAAAVVIGAVALTGLLAAGIQVARKHFEVRRQLAYSYLLRAQQYAARGDDASAALCYAELNHFASSRVAQANAHVYLDKLLAPSRIITGKTGVAGGALSRDGKLLVVGYEDGTAQLLRMPDGISLRDPFRVAEQGSQVFPGVSGNGKRFFIRTSRSKSIAVWDVATGQRLGETGEAGSFGPAALAVGEGGEIAVGWSGSYKEVMLVRFSDRGTRAVNYVSKSPEALTTVGVAIDGTDSHVAIFRQKVVEILDAGSGRCVAEFINREDNTLGGVFSPDGRLLFIWTSKACVFSWEWARKNSRPEMLFQGQVAITRCALSPDGKRLLVGCNDGNAFIWDLARRARLDWPAIRHSSWISDACFSGDGAWFALSGHDGIARVWSAASGEPKDIVVFHDLTAEWARLDLAGRFLVTHERFGPIRIWDLEEKGATSASLDQAGWGLIGVGGPGGKLLKAYYDGTARLYDVWSCTPTGVTIDYQGMSPLEASLGPKGDVALISFMDGSYRAYSTTSGKALSDTLSHPSAYAWLVKFSGDGEVAVVGGGDTAVACGTKDWKQKGKPIKAPPTLMAFCVSPDGRLLATSDSGNGIRVWSFEDGTELGSPIWRKAPALSMEFSPDGRTVAVGGEGDKGLLLLDVEGKSVKSRTLPAPAGIYRVAFSPDGRRVAAGCADHNAYVWDTATGRPALKPLPHDWMVSLIGFTPDGEWIFTGTYQGKVRFWDAGCGDPVGSPLEVGGPPLRLWLKADQSRMAVDINAMPQTRTYDTSWMRAKSRPDDLLDRTRLATRRKFTSDGSIRALSPEELQALQDRIGRGKAGNGGGKP